MTSDDPEGEPTTAVDPEGSPTTPVDSGGDSTTADSEASPPIESADRSVSERTVERRARGEWAVVAALSIAGAGIVVGSPFLVVVATLPLWYAAAAVLGSRQRAMVRLERRLVVEDGGAGTADRAPGATEDAAGDRPGSVVSGDPGDTVAVRTTVRNVGSEPIVDLRVVDGVPEELPVVSGTPRTCVALDPLETVTIEYEVLCRRGEHRFADATVRTRDLTGTVTETWTASAAGQETVRCSATVDTVPLGGGTNDYAGEVPTDEGGSGVEFYSVREYEPGDPVGSIDWRQYARTRDLATVEYRAERSTRIVCVVDARSSQFAGATAAHPPAVELSIDAAERTVETLLSAGHPAGVAAIRDRRVAVVRPGTDPATRRRATELLSEARRKSTLRGTAFWSLKGDPATELAGTLPGEAQVYLFSAFVDDEPLDLVERLRAEGYAVRAVSPDVTADADDVATRLQALDRRTRLGRARRTGARVVDWDLDRPLGLVLRDAIEGVQTR